MVGSLLFATGIWTYWTNTLTTYYLTDQRLAIETRLFGSNVDDLDLHKIKTRNIHRPFYLRVFGLGNITLDTGARRLSVVRHIRKTDEFADEIAKAMHRLRKR